MLDIELLCGHEGCLSTELWARGLCEIHYRRSVRRPVPGERKSSPFRKVRVVQCAVGGCPAVRIHGRGYCNAHYLRWLRTGDPGPPDLLHQGPPPPRALKLTVRAGPACGLSTAHLFDPDDEQESRAQREARHWQAAELCAGCPARAQCAICVPDVADTAPTTAGGSGVWAGQLILAAGPRPVQDPNVKMCTGCRDELPLSAFPRTVQAGRSTNYRCSECSAAYERARRARWTDVDRARHAELARARYARPRESA